MRVAKTCEKCGTFSRLVKTYRSPYSPVEFRLCNLCRDELKADLNGESK